MSCHIMYNLKSKSPGEEWWNLEKIRTVNLIGPNIVEFQ